MNYTGYLSGRITGCKNYRSIFDKYWYKCVNGGYRVFNPARHIIPKKGLMKKQIWQKYLKYDIKILCDCSVIYMIPGWWRSKGARFERNIAKKLGIKIVYLKKIR